MDGTTSSSKYGAIIITVFAGRNHCWVPVIMSWLLGENEEMNCLISVFRGYLFSSHSILLRIIWKTAVKPGECQVSSALLFRNDTGDWIVPFWVTSRYDCLLTDTEMILRMVTFYMQKPLLSTMAREVFSCVILPRFLGQHRTNASADLSGSFAPVLQFQKWEIHTVFPHFWNFEPAQNLSLSFLADLCGVALGKMISKNGDLAVLSSFIQKKT